MSNQAQSEFWNGEAGQRWVDQSSQLDAMLLPIADQILSAANIQGDEDVLDIGCGAGALSLKAAKMGRSVLGVDISEPLIDLAWSRSEMIDSVNFKRADASALNLDKKRDIFLSRFGVMFFSDPVSAFANAAFMMEMGPLSKILKEQELDFEPIQQALVNKLSASADKDGHVDMQGAAWIVKATAS